jgi:anaerobic ribonucleoside-triphosphate reductase activating protein
MALPAEDPGCRKKSELKLAGFLTRSSVNGPGIRAVIWVQGCPLRCSGCFNPGFLPFSHECLVPVKDLAEKILAIDCIDGVTFSGGEPFAQAAPLAELGMLVRQAGMSVVTFTGFTWDQLNAKKRPAWRSLLAVTDILIAGPFSPKMHARLYGQPRSTGKQVVRLCEGKPVGWKSGNSRQYPGSVQEIEFTIRQDGQIVVTGFPENRIVEGLASFSPGE